MSDSNSTLKALGVRLSRPSRAWRNRLTARRARLGGRPDVAETLPEPILIGDADRGSGLVAGRWHALGHRMTVAPGSIWEVTLPEPRLEAERQSCFWLDDLAALGSRAARTLAQAWVQDWIRRYGSGNGPGWEPELAGRRTKRWAVHAALLTEGLDRVGADRFWRTLAMHQRYLEATWPQAAEGLPRLRALAGLVWSGIALPHDGHRAAVTDLGLLAEELVDSDGGTPTRAPEDLAEILILLIWTARLLENAGEHAAPAHLAAIVRAVPVIRPLRLGDGTLARFHGGSGGAPERLDQALAELRLGVQAKPRLAMGFVRLSGGRVTLVMDGAEPPIVAAPLRAHAGTLAFEMSSGRQPVIVNAGSGRAFGPDWALAARQTAAHSTAEIDGRSSARLETRGLAANTFGAMLCDGPSLVSVRQAQDATGQWLLAKHDGYVASHGLLHERRLFVAARGVEVRGEEIMTVADARARAQFDRVAEDGRVVCAVRFHLHPSIEPELEPARQLVHLALPNGEAWVFRIAGGMLDLEDSVYFDPTTAAPAATTQMVVRTEVVEYLGQVIWSLSRIAEPGTGPATTDRPEADDPS